jgi:hypothetical protein
MKNPLRKINPKILYWAVPLFLAIWLVASLSLFSLSIISGGDAQDIRVTLKSSQIPGGDFIYRRSLRINRVFADFTLQPDNSWVQLKKYASALEFDFTEKELDSLESLTISIGITDFTYTSSEIRQWEQDKQPQGNLYMTPPDLHTNSSMLSRFSDRFALIINYPQEGPILKSSFFKALILLLFGPLALWGFFILGDYLLNKIGRQLSWEIFLYLACLIFALAFLGAPGIHDVQESWLHGWWMTSYDDLGFIKGYADAGDNYPPLSFVFLGILQEGADFFQVDVFYLYKISIFIFLIWMSILLRRQTQNWIYPSGFILAMTLATVGHGYTDYLIGPFLMISLLLLKRDKWLGAALVFTVGLLMKWQPLMLLPFIFLYLIKVNTLKDLAKADWKRILLQVIGPVVLLFLLTLLIWGPHFGASLLKGMSHSALSFYGLNANWILTFFHKLSNPGLYGSPKGSLSYIYTGSVAAKISSLLFLGTYVFALHRFFIKRNKTWPDLIRYMIIGYLTYFMFNKGVHQNHLFMIPVLIPLLYDPKAQEQERQNNVREFLFWSLLMNANLILFYGINGQRDLNINRFIGGYDLIPLFLAFTGLMVYLFMYLNIIKNKDEL